MTYYLCEVFTDKEISFGDLFCRVMNSDMNSELKSNVNKCKLLLQQGEESQIVKNAVELLQFVSLNYKFYIDLAVSLIELHYEIKNE